MLQYEVGQYYGGHHDFIPAHSRLPCGPRVYTLFMYLSEVEEGGETELQNPEPKPQPQPKPKPHPKPKPKPKPHPNPNPKPNPHPNPNPNPDPDPKPNPNQARRSSRGWA